MLYYSTNSTKSPIKYIVEGINNLAYISLRIFILHKHSKALTTICQSDDLANGSFGLCRFRQIIMCIRYNVIYTLLHCLVASHDMFCSKHRLLSHRSLIFWPMLLRRGCFCQYQSNLFE